jgi:hypothetical protein
LRYEISIRDGTPIVGTLDIGGTALLGIHPDEYEEEMKRLRPMQPTIRVIAEPVARSVAPEDAVGAEGGEVEAEDGEAEEAAVDE